MRRLLAAALMLASCAAPTVPASPTPSPSPLPLVELRYRVFDQVGRPWYCDPDFFPIARADEKELARQRFPEIEKDASFAAILAHNGIQPGAAYSLGDSLLLAIYQDWKDLQRLPLDPTGPPGVYGSTFVVRPRSSSKAAQRVELRVNTAGKVDVLSRTAAGPPNCPICLADSTLIATPHGPTRVTDLRTGDLVWTSDADGSRVAARVLETGSVAVPIGHTVLRIRLADGRSVSASPGHPDAAARPLGSLLVGDQLDGAAITAIERLPYWGRTYDLLPAGPTGAYWADGVLLGSTLRR